MLPCKDIAETLSQAPHGFRRTVSWYRVGSSKAQGAQIIYTVAMIGVVMSPENAINSRVATPDQLLAQVRRSIDQQS